MSYRIYTSDAFIIASKHSRDADLSILAFTESFGILHAAAKSARHLKSKLRYSLQSLTFGSLSMVKGREIWRVTSARKMISLYDNRIQAEARVLLARALSHVARFCPREQPEPAIFEMLKALSGFIFKDLSANAAAGSAQSFAVNCARLEKVFALRLMHELGYVEKNEKTRAFLTEKIDSSFMAVLERIAEDEEKAIDFAVERAIAQSHL